ncbi:hypothetical protein AX15_001395 [Amanita polypyramis BW_CC]|nr:hypothetical protein AX15_001395 [Amanita polypyramis BW_CC]
MGTPIISRSPSSINSITQLIDTLTEDNARYRNKVHRSIPGEGKKILFNCSDLISKQLQINSGKPILIDFWATWCGPCRVISPILEKISNDPNFAGVEFYKVDVDEQGEISQEVGIRAMPTFILYKDGNKVGDLVGAVPAKLEALAAQAKSFVAV